MQQANVNFATADKSRTADIVRKLQADIEAGNHLIVLERLVLVLTSMYYVK